MENGSPCAFFSEGADMSNNRTVPVYDGKEAITTQYIRWPAWTIPLLFEEMRVAKGESGFVNRRRSDRLRQDRRRRRRRREESRHHGKELRGGNAHVRVSGDLGNGRPPCKRPTAVIH
jgi:hypothetical protein